MALAWTGHKERNTHCASGILADDQGLGKTISMIALILKQMPQYKFASDDNNCVKYEALNLDEGDDRGTEVDKTILLYGDNDRKLFFSNGLESWKKKVLKSADLSVLVYHGGFRTKCPGDLTRYDVVHTTYSNVTNEVPKQHMTDDDEGEQKRLDKYGLSSEFSLNKKRRQTSSGQNKVEKRGKRSKDSHLNVDSGPLARVSSFCASIKYPISRNTSSGYRKLQVLQKVQQVTWEYVVTVMLMSLKAGSLGLNMVAACHVILLDLWWNPTTEDQAVESA
ncbi:SNF2 family N-terminal domain [Musa troglodytarum]|uniref:SNF2 family N-terminal domain n=1 Tax=Musa troglodytarum TaxID=320322 RepID=A0A9E7JZ57_9LILI|nr:SNF2 family N-terminal domain [Musa troglodytarum]